jgi:hypothetical protein
MALLENVIIAQLIKKFSGFYGTRRFISAFTESRHWSVLSQMNPIHSVQPCVLSIHFKIFFVSLGLHSDMVSSRQLFQPNVCTHFSFLLMSFTMIWSSWHYISILLKKSQLFNIIRIWTYHLPWLLVLSGQRPERCAECFVWERSLQEMTSVVLQCGHTV